MGQSKGLAGIPEGTVHATPTNFRNLGNAPSHASLESRVAALEGEPDSSPALLIGAMIDCGSDFPDDATNMVPVGPYKPSESTVGNLATSQVETPAIEMTATHVFEPKVKFGVGVDASKVQVYGGWFIVENEDLSERIVIEVHALPQGTTTFDGHIEVTDTTGTDLSLVAGKVRTAAGGTYRASLQLDFHTYAAL